MYGVRKCGCSRRIPSGIWRCMPIEYTSRETPSTPAFVAATRIVTARTPT